MTLPSPNLDDRTFEGLIAEAKQRITSACPQWTDFNPSDPGMTLVELMAWMTELLIYRINRIPDKSYIEFLNLMGVRLQPPQASGTWVVFTPAAGATERDLPHIPVGTVVATTGGNQAPIRYETTAALDVTAARIVKICSRHGEKDKEFPIEESSLHDGWDIFSGERLLDHCLYLGEDPRLYLGEDPHLNQGRQVDLKLLIEIPPDSTAEVQIEWECWNGRQWEIIVPQMDETHHLRRSGAIVFDTLPELELLECRGQKAFWLRARLLSVRDQALPSVESLQRSFEVHVEHGIPPEKALVVIPENNAEADPFMPGTKQIDLMHDFYPFGRSCQPGDSLYLTSRWFGKTGARITIQVLLSEAYHPETGEFLPGLEVGWEYYAADRQWHLLGKTSSTGVTASEHGFQDESEAFTHSGRIQFTVPADMAVLDQDAEGNFWIRARISAGGYGKTPPLISTLRIGFQERAQPFFYCWADNYKKAKVFTDQARSGEPFIPFELDTADDPAFYMALDAPPANRLQRIFFRFADAVDAKEVKVVWEFFGPDGWEKFNLLADSTHRFAHTGAIEFIGPADWNRTEVYHQKGYWMRVRWVSGAWSIRPRLLSVHLNATPVLQVQTISQEVLGSSSGLAYQVHRFANSPILPDPHIYIREPDDTSEEHQKKLKTELDAADIYTPETDLPGIWVRWREAENFFRAGPDSRHYLLDPLKGTITFGDDIRGRIPPKGTDNIMAGSYRIGGGGQGNVGAECITVLESSLPAIDSVTNPEPATGGADIETVADARLRGPWMLKHRDRAVTMEDYEQLAMAASVEVAKATCFVDNGDIILIIVPKGDDLILKPGVTLIERVQDYLDQRRLITTRLKIKGPDYIGVVVDVDVSLVPAMAAKSKELRSTMEKNLSLFFHPLHGGPEGHGWPMGRAVHISEIYYALEKIRGVDFVKSIELNKDIWCKRIGLSPSEYPFLKRAEISFI